MKLNKDRQKMACKIPLLFLAMTAITASATADSALVQRQNSLLDKLDSLNSAVLGFRLGGTVKGGILSSTLSSDQLADQSPSRENQAYTDANLIMTARPSAETEARVELRLHKDWQSAYEEGLNPVIGHWFSYDGTILNKHVDFNLGYMRVGYTPLTIYVPETEILQEPEIFGSRRRDVLAMRNLDTTTNQLLQGLNVEYHSGNVGMLSDVYVQATGARIRNIAKKDDQVFFDFDWSDRYMMAANAGASAYGATLGVNFVESFDRELSTRSRNASSTYYYEDNYVWSGILNFDSKGVVDAPVRFGVNTELGVSHWIYEQDSYVTDTTETYSLEQGYGTKSSDTEHWLDTTFYVVKTTKTSLDWHDSVLDRKNDVAFNIRPFAAISVADFDIRVSGMYLQNGENFWSEQASTPTYRGSTSILNAGALYSGQDSTVLENFRSGSLENLYFAVYNTDVLQQQNLMSKNETSDILEEGQSESNYTYSRLYNNYRLAHFYRNGYGAVAYKYQEYAAMSEFLDPSVNMAMPMGLATPDRKGFSVSGDFSWNDVADVNIRFAQYNQDVVDNKFTQFGVGLGLDFAPLIDFPKQLKIQGSIEMASEDKYLERKTSRIVTGATLGIWGPFSVLAGAQFLTKDYGNGLYLSETVVVQKVEESLILFGPQVKLAPGAVLNLQGGVMTNKVSYDVATVSQKLSIDKMLIMADVTVSF